MADVSELVKRLRRTDGWKSVLIHHTPTVRHTEVFSDAPLKAADALTAQQQEIERLRGLLWYGWNEMNTIRAESGVPRSYDGTPKAIDEVYWSNVVDAMADALGDDCKPWPSPAASAALTGKEGGDG